MARKEYYKVLGIHKTETLTGIKKAYRDLAKQNHPDKIGGNGSRMIELNEAYEILRDKKKRDEYDRGEEVSVEKWGYDYEEEIPKDESAVAKYTGHLEELNRAWTEIRIFYSRGGGYSWDGAWVEVGATVSDYYLKRVENLLKVLNSYYKPQYLEAKNEAERYNLIRIFSFWDHGSGLSNEVNWNNNFNRIKKMLDHARKESFELKEIAYESLQSNIAIEGNIDINEYNRLYYHGKHETIIEYWVLRGKIYDSSESLRKYKAVNSTLVDEVWKETGKAENMGEFRSIWAKDSESRSTIEEIKRFNQSKLEEMKKAIPLMKKLIEEGESYKPGIEDESVKDKKQTEIEVEVGKNFSEKSKVISRDIQRLIHESQRLIGYEELEAKVKEIEKYQEERVYKNYQKQIGDLKIKLNGINDGNYRKGVVERIEDKLKEVGKKESDLTDKERDDLVKIENGGITNLNDIGKIENGIIARISKSKFSDVLNNLLKASKWDSRKCGKGHCW